MVIYRHAFHFVFNLIIVEKRLFQNFRNAISDHCDFSIVILYII